MAHIGAGCADASGTRNSVTSMPRRSRETTASNTYRFFVDPGALRDGRLRLEDAELAHQIGAVLRLGPGERVVLLDGEGWQYVVLLERVDRRGALEGAVERREPAEGAEPRTDLTLYLPLIRPERFEWALQKGAELGVSAFVPTVCARGIAEGGPAARKLERWRKILREAAEQARRGRLPSLEPPLPFAEACSRAAATGPALLLWEQGGAQSLRAVLRGHDIRPRSILSGPEGGLSEEERRAADEHGIIAVSLGPRTLRAETAPIVAASAIFYEHGDLE
jgi:16S rRNA (uracil1498-N3)-methyltransferase